MLIVPKTKSLILPPKHNLVATPAATGSGITVAAHATINTKGSWVEMFAAAAVTYDVFGITLMISNDSTAATVVRNLYDIGIGGAGVEVVLVPNILNTGTLATPSAPNTFYFLPIFIPKGTRIAMRKQSNITVKTSSCMLFLHGGGGMPPWDVFTDCDSYATDTATSGGLAHTPGSTGTYSTWTNIGATLSRNYGAILPMIGSGSNTTMGNRICYLQMGVNSVIFGQYVYSVTAGETVGGMWPSIALYNRWALGTQIMLRSTEDAGAVELEFGFLAFY